MAKATIVAVSPSALQVRTVAGPVTLSIDQRTQVRQGPERKKLADLKTGADVTISYVEKAAVRRATYVYIAQAGGANPCAAKNTCAAKNPCAPKK
jgi:hypothetical protein